MNKYQKNIKRFETLLKKIDTDLEQNRKELWKDNGIIDIKTIKHATELYDENVQLFSLLIDLIRAKTTIEKHRIEYEYNRNKSK